MFGFTNVDVDIIRKVGITNDHTLIYGRTRRYKQIPSALRVKQPVGNRFARFKGNKRTRVSALQIPFVRLVGLEKRVHNPLTLGIRQELALITEQSARRHGELQTHTVADGRHL